MSPGGVALVVAVVASSALLRCDALYFMVTEGVTRCFLEDGSQGDYTAASPMR